MDIEIGNVGNVNIDISSEDIELEAQTQTREVGEATSYEELNNLPQINDVTLIGNVSLNELGIQSKGNYLTSETDPIFSASASAGITSQDITAWNAKADSSAIPTKTSDLTNDGDGISESKFATESFVNTHGGKIDKIKVNGTEQTITNKSVDITIPTNNNQLINGAGYITGIDSTDVTTALGFTPYNSTNPDGYQTSNEVESAINTKISSTYKAKGSVIFANLPSLASSNEGNVYNVSDSFTTTSDFVEGAGKSYPAGTNVVIMNTTGSTYKYDVLSGMVDLSGYQTKIDSTHKLSSDLVDDTNNTNKFVTSAEKTTWSNKYDKPLTGIPSTDLSSTVQTSLSKADTAIQSSDLTNYVANTDYPTNQDAGVIKTSDIYGVQSVSGQLMGSTRTIAQYSTDVISLLISKGTLENVLANKGYETDSNKVTSISSSSTNTEYPSALAVYNYIQSLDASEVSY